MKGLVYDGLVVLALLVGLVVALCGRHYLRRCDHCGGVTYYMPRGSNEIVAARESILDRIIDNYRGGIYHWDCLPYHNFGGCYCGS